MIAIDWWSSKDVQFILESLSLCLKIGVMKNELALKQRIAELEKLLENERQLSLQKDALIAALEER